MRWRERPDRGLVEGRRLLALGEDRAGAGGDERRQEDGDALVEAVRLGAVAEEVKRHRHDHGDGGALEHECHALGCRTT